MKVLVTGASGQLGFDLMKILNSRRIDALGVSSQDMDITRKEDVDRVFDSLLPSCCIHCAAWTAVDRAEDEPQSAHELNVYGTENVASACQRQGASLMYFSTDYVFGGGGVRPWKPGDETDPQNVYGQTKLEGEKMVQKYLPDRNFILRIEWIYGINGRNFVKTMLNLAKTHPHLRVVNDQTGSPSYTPDIASLAVDMILTQRYGTYHVANTGYCTWYEFAREIFKKAGLDTELEPVTSEQYPTRAKRPHNSRLDTSRLIQNGFSLLPDWRDALTRFMIELGYQQSSS